MVKKLWRYVKPFSSDTGTLRTDGQTDRFAILISRISILRCWRAIKMVQHTVQLYLQWPTNRKSYMIYRTAPLSVTLNNPYPHFKVTPFFDAEYLRNGTTYRYNVIEILTGTHTRPTQQCHFEWSWVILSDLAKYSMTRSVARSLATAELLVDFLEELVCLAKFTVFICYCVRL